jgi:hypothetical protein
MKAFAQLIKYLLSKNYKMRFIKTPSSTKEGDIRTITKFLLLPVTIGNETRWMETATIKQEAHYMFDVTCGASWWEWRNVQFI